MSKMWHFSGNKFDDLCVSKSMAQKCEAKVKRGNIRELEIGLWFP